MRSSLMTCTLNAASVGANAAPRNTGEPPRQVEHHGGDHRAGCDRERQAETEEPDGQRRVGLQFPQVDPRRRR